jgi:hypothetical protein
VVDDQPSKEPNPEEEQKHNEPATPGAEGHANEQGQQTVHDDMPPLEGVDQSELESLLEKELLAADASHDDAPGEEDDDEEPTNQRRSSRPITLSREAMEKMQYGQMEGIPMTTMDRANAAGTAPEESRTHAPAGALKNVIEDKIAELEQQRIQEHAIEKTTADGTVQAYPEAPKTYKAMLKRSDKARFQQGMKEHIEKIRLMQSYKVVALKDIPADANVMRGRWVFADSLNAFKDGHSPSARYTACGYSQQYLLD